MLLTMSTMHAKKPVENFFAYFEQSQQTCGNAKRMTLQVRSSVLTSKGTMHA